MKHLKLILLSAALFVAVGAFAKKNTKVLLETNMGNIKVVLYEQTPIHSKNFIKLVKKDFFNGLLFHRVIKDFMIQGGDPDSKNAEAGKLLGEGDLGYSLAPEFRTPEIFHKKGALAAARESDDVNPNRESSASQFYIVHGKIFDDAQLDKVQKRIDSKTDGKVKLTPQMRQVYKTIGGTPHLDGQYTVFGEVIEGLDVLEKIQQVATDNNDRPNSDVLIIKAKIVRK